MMNAADRKSAIAAYRERKIIAGVYAIRCLTSGQAWVGAAPDVETIQNRLWFTLRHGGNAHPVLQVAWKAHGEGGFVFEVLEPVVEESAYVRGVVLKERAVHWREQLSAFAL